MINNNNYFDLNNKGLSQSKIKDYLICPNYFYRKNITGEYKREFKKAFQIGDAVDNILTRAEELDNYAVCENSRVTKAGKAEAMDLEMLGKSIITRTDFNTIIEIANAVEITDVYKEIVDTFTFQEIIVIDNDKLGEHFNCLYGKLDAYRINEDGVCDLLDLKTSVSIDDRKYLYKFYSLGYDKQMWFYAKLLRAKYPQIKSFRYWHLAVEKTEPYNVKLFSIPEGMIFECGALMEETISKIASDKEFKKTNPSFKNPTILGSYNDDKSSLGGWDD